MIYNFSSEYISETNESRDFKKYLYTHIHMALFAILKRWKQPIMVWILNILQKLIFRGEAFEK
jgi:hypothetical protein